MNPLDISLLRELFRITPYLFSVIAVVLFFFFHDTELLFFSIGSFCNGAFNGVLKHFIRAIFPSVSWINAIIERPPGAINCSCIIDPTAKAASTPLGMPSGHCQSMGFFVGYLWSRFYHMSQKVDPANASADASTNANTSASMDSQPSLTYTLLIGVFGIVLMFIMAISRLGKDSWLFAVKYLPRDIVADSNGCHTLSQTIVGTLVGLALGGFWHYMDIIDR